MRRVDCVGLIGFLLIGTIAGWLAGQFVKGRGFGLLGNMAVGVVGALIGGFVFRFVGLVPYTTCGSLVTATIGAIILLGLAQVLREK